MYQWTQLFVGCDWNMYIKYKDLNSQIYKSLNALVGVASIIIIINYGLLKVINLEYILLI